MAFVEKTGKTVDEAVAEALKSLNITADQAEIEVLEEGKKAFLGFFGGKNAKVRVTVKEAAAPAEEVSVKASEKTFSEAASEGMKYMIILCWGPPPAGMVCLEAIKVVKGDSTGRI